MTSAPLLDLLLALIDDHARNPSRGLTVIPVVNEDLEQDHNLIEAAFRRYGGEYIAAGKIVNAQVPGALDTILRDIVQSTIAAARLGYEIEVVEDGPTVRAGIVRSRFPTNPSQQTVLSVVAALFSESFQRTNLGAVSWDETTLDDSARRAIWELMTTQLNGRRLGTLSTLVSISRGSVDPGVHCLGAISARYAISGGAFLRRKHPVDLDAVVGDLVRRSSEVLVLFLGAGFSRSAEMPLGNDLRDYALEQFFAPAVIGEAEIPYRFHQWVTDNHRLLAGEESLSADQFVAALTLERVLREEFRRLRNRRADSPTLAHIRRNNARAVATRSPARLALGRLAKKIPKLVLFTVNFDQVIEAELAAEVQVFATKDELDQIPTIIDTYVKNGGRIPLIKLHGSIDKPESIVADVEATARGLTADVSRGLRTLLNDASPISWVYVGYSMRDPDLNDVFGPADFAIGAFERWVSPFPDQSVRYFAELHRDARWDEKGYPPLQERLVTETADRFLHALDEMWPAPAPRATAVA